ncbi:AraC family transcriptional regulator [Chitinophaga polysaccharea]|uniref:AraC family transcriptional regulator n=1 Tax=Chitinophaga polysaccharea TaxID=1293035 RepID=A0A561PPE2_9BACT|nr:substrate-binding domain-containing protein [Chitinophaga polysaccharea]TWF39984.1 AraC family transcriptional regulator [Chitinophaga polysaccharea]
MKTKQKVAVLLDASRAYDRDILTGIADFNKIHDKFLFFFFSPKFIHADHQHRLIERVKAWKPDGIITREMDGLKQLFRLKVPLIILPHTSPYVEQVNVWGDNYAVGDLAAAYFIPKGYSNFAFLGFKDFKWSQEREAAYVKYIENAGYGVHSFNFDNTHLLWEDLPGKLAKWLARLPRPCAVFSVTDELSTQLLEAAKTLGIRVPDDLSILGADNDEMICEISSPTLSSIDHNARLAGTQAAMALSRWIEFKERPPGIIGMKPTAVIARNSTNAMAVNDEQVRVALHYIANAAPVKDITVLDVVKATTLSRRALEKRFHLLLQSSILEEIKKVRVERIKYLLEHSRFTVQQIACEMNFRNLDNITRYFRGYAGITPKIYRSRFK